MIHIGVGFAAFMANDELDNDEEKDYPSNLSELLQTAVIEDSSYHHLGLLSLNAVIWNLDIQVYLVTSLNFQVISQIRCRRKTYCNYAR